MPPLSIQLLTENRIMVDALGIRLDTEPDLVLDPPTPLRRVAIGHDPPDVVILDGASLGGWVRTLQDLLRPVRTDVPLRRLVVLAPDTSAVGAAEAVRAGAMAWLPPRCGADELVDVLRGVGRGEAFFPPEVLGPVLDALRAELRDVPEPASPIDTLTLREREVLACLVAGWNARNIAAHLDMADNTVRTHTTRICRKLGVHSQVEAVRVAHDAGLTSQILGAAATTPTPPSSASGPFPRGMPRRRRPCSPARSVRLVPGTAFGREPPG